MPACNGADQDQPELRQTGLLLSFRALNTSPRCRSGVRPQPPHARTDPVCLVQPPRNLTKPCSLNWAPGVGRGIRMKLLYFSYELSSTKNINFKNPHP